METLQMIQTVTPASMMVALLMLPWLAALLMQAVSTGSSIALDDKWNTRAQAAVRWAGAVVMPANAQRNTVPGSAARYSARTHATESFLHAA